MVISRATVESPIEILLDGSFNDVNLTGNLDITIIAHDQITQQGLKIRIALTEDSVYYSAPNGTQWHNFTMRDMIPREVGISIELSQGDTLRHSEGFACLSPLEYEHCRLVVWVQADDSNKEILQTAAIDVFDIATSIDEEIEIPTEISLAQNYPNPFNAKTTIYYNLKNTSTVKLEIYDLAGRKVATLTDAVQSAGDYQVVWDAGSVASGVYFYHLTADDKNLTKRMVLLK
ncbi:MAG: T9SS type A sorting domain-containing protein [candidate division Zixibacteria bacterium]|nr:T9SS type A sorting domain-containing protein [candidate division Zixibacteria bacterium]